MSDADDVLPPSTSIGRTALRVADLGEMTEFYRDIVGLQVLDRDSSRAVLGVDGTPLLVLDAEERAPRERSAAGLYHNAFRFPSQAALGDALTRVREGWELDGASDHRVSEALYLQDPEGNGVELYRDYPREEWPTGDDGRVTMGTDPLDLAAVEAAAAGEDRAPPGTDVGHVHLEVTSLAAFREFYVDTLGFEQQMAVRGASFVSAGGYHHHVGANTWQGRQTPADGRGLAWFEVLVSDEAALEAVRERAGAAGGDVRETDEGIAVTDADGIEIRIRVDGSLSAVTGG